MTSPSTGTGSPGGRITQHSIEQVLQRADIVEIISGYSQLKRQGVEWSGRCPFHDEKTPSFTVNPDKGVYHCFGCGAGGDTVTFIQQKMGLEFVEAVEYLADRYRIELEREESGKARSGPRIDKRRLYELLDLSAGFCSEYLWRSGEAEPVRAYLASRGLTEETARAFRLGFSPRQARGISARARDKGFSRGDLENAKLINRGGRDFFQGRLMFPIVDKADRVIAFGARKLFNDDPLAGKYINSADGVVFQKKSTLYLPPGIREAARQTGHVVIVEGYMDVITMWQYGFKNCVAPMGTALTDEQIIEVKRLAPLATFAFDPDTEGTQKTIKVLERARTHELDVRIALLREGDPAEILSMHDGDGLMKDLLDSTVTLMHYRISSILGGHALNTPEGRDHAWKDGIAYLRAQQDSPEWRRQVDRLAMGLGLDSAGIEALRKTVGATGQLPGRSADRGGASGNTSVRPSSGQLVLEKRFLALSQFMFESGWLAPNDISGAGDHLMHEFHKKFFALLLESPGGKVDTSKLHDDATMLGFIASLSAFGEREKLHVNEEIARTMLAELQVRLEEKHLSAKAVKLKEKLASGDDSVLDDLTVVESRRRKLLRELRHAD